jgi:hypothetical protein
VLKRPHHIQKIKNNILQVSNKKQTSITLKKIKQAFKISKTRGIIAPKL